MLTLPIREGAFYSIWHDNSESKKRQETGFNNLEGYLDYNPQHLKAIGDNS
jgi:hypothetical protein